MIEIHRSLTLPDVIIIEPQVFKDDRGLFFESFQAERYAPWNIPPSFVQDNFSRSAKNVLRGLHYQKNHTQGKLVYVTRGSAIDVAVDIRRNSPTFSQSVCIMLDDQTFRQVYIPPGFAHGFCALSEQVDFFYKCTNYYDAASEMTILWNDPDLGIRWPVQHPLVSKKDQAGKCLKDMAPEDLPLWIPS